MIKLPPVLKLFRKRFADSLQLPVLPLYAGHQLENNGSARKIDAEIAAKALHSP
jgi:hypothetical protein